MFAAEAIRTHRIEPARALLKLGIRQTGETLVWRRYDGEPMIPENLSRQFPIAVVKAGPPRITFHGLRHSRATQMLVAGVYLKEASERLGTPASVSPWTFIPMSCRGLRKRRWRRWTAPSKPRRPSPFTHP